MEHNLWSPLSECIVQTRKLAHITDNRDEAEFWELLLEFETEVVHWCLSIVEEYKLFDTEGCKLTGELRTD